MDAPNKRWLIWILLVIGALLVLWLDHTHPLPVRVIRNGSKTIAASGSRQGAPLAY
jgi:hypothetical protein